jgi:hypothetical protein
MAQSAGVANDRPHLGHQTEKVSEYGLPDDTPGAKTPYW